ncbi:MAG: 3-oxoacyl-ACP reductase FabG [Clostridia bacterium]|nr:3-oxoacyl-ACP reductase FabG [Clostridia bacterium]
MKTVLITGSSRGIGSACVRLFAEKGYNVALNYNKSDSAATALENEFENVAKFCADVSDKNQVDAMVSAVKSRFGSVDILINNAGIAQSKLFSDITDEDFDQMVSVHLKGAFNCTQAVLSDMIDKKSGRIINISSIWGITGASCEVHYSMVKSGLIGFTKALAKELAPSGITVNAIAPGVVDTDMMSGFTADEIKEIEKEIPLGRLASPSEIALSALFLAEDGGDYITGQVISPNGGIVI